MTTKQSTILERSPAVIALMTHLIHVPGLLKEFTTLVCHRSLSSITLEEILKIRDRAHAILEDLQQWFEVHFKTFNSVVKASRGTVYCLEALYSSFSIFVGRLLAGTGGIFIPQARLYERKCQNLAQRVLFIENELRHTGYGELLLAQKIQVAAATAATSDEWQEFLDNDELDGPMLIGPVAFKRWCALFDRSTN
jgi:hypothetical protein